MHPLCLEHAFVSCTVNCCSCVVCEVRSQALVSCVSCQCIVYYRNPPLPPPLLCPWVSYLRLLGAGGLEVPVEHLLDDVREKAGDDDDDDCEPDRAAGQQLDEDKVHVLGVKERPGGGQRSQRITLLASQHLLRLN